MNKTQYKQYYYTPEVKFTIIKFLKNREFALYDKVNTKRTVRTLRVHSVQHFDIVTRATGMFLPHDDYYNVYTSVAKFKDGIPFLTLNFRVRDTSVWNKTHYQEMVGYDLFLDIDSPDHASIDTAKEDTINIVEFLDACNVPYKLRFSGCGFHIIIPFEYLPRLPFDPHSAEKTIYQFCIKIAKFFHDEFSELIDTSVYDSRRLIKLPYTIATYGDKNYVARPIYSKRELLNFNLKQFDIRSTVRRLQALRTERSFDYDYIFNPNGNIKKLLEVI